MSVPSTSRTKEECRRVFEFAREYLLSFKGVSADLLDRHLNNWKTRKPESMNELLLAVLSSSSNRRNVIRSIGDISSLGPLIFEFDPTRILEEYNADWQSLFRDIQASYKPPGRMLITNRHNYWVIFSKSILSSSKFLSGFSSIAEFDEFVSQFYLNEYTRVALPLLLEKEIFGLGFATACDFLKENGYPKFAKPDVHIKAIFNGLGLSSSTSDYEVFKDVIRFSDAIDQVPYVVDKMFWLVGSGYFYLNDIRIKTDRASFILKTMNEFGS